MGKVVLKGFQVNEIKANNAPRVPGKIELEYKYSFNLKKLIIQKSIGEFRVTVINKNDPADVLFDVVCSSLFEYEDGMDENQIHLEAMTQIYPYVRSFMLTLSSNMGITPLMIPPVDFSNISIVSVKIPPKKD